MKKIWTKYLTVFCVLVCVLSLTACSEEKEDGAVSYNDSTAEVLEEQAKLYKRQAAQSGADLGDDYDGEKFAQEQMDSVIQYIVSNYIEADKTELKELSKDDDLQGKAADSYLEATEGIGEYQPDSAYDLSLVMDEESMTGQGMLKFKERDVKFSLTLTLESSEIAVTFEKDLTLLEILEKAGMNTLLGMGTVFLVLILISLVISCFGLINKAQQKTATEKAESVPAIPAEPEPFLPQEEDVSDDLELVAVISAAIAAAENTSADGFVVRSIKRVNASNRRRA